MVNMGSRTRITIRNAAKSDLPRLANLIHFEAFSHRHLDYRPPLDWVSKEPFLVLEENKRIEAALACPPDPPEVSWLRLFTVSTQTSPLEAWEHLWQEALNILVHAHRVQFIAAIPLYHWFKSILKHSQFEQTNSIIMLNREIPGSRFENPPSNLHIRAMKSEDILAVEEIDHLAFETIWANSRDYLEAAYRLSICAAVAETDNTLVGYQITTPSAIGGHLARLAVRPEVQNQGLGRMLLSDLIQRLTTRGARAITVNTQKDNLASLRLYQKMGFVLTGEEYPIYELKSF